MFSNRKKKQKVYLIGIPGINMHVMTRKPFELDYDEECLEGMYVEFTNDTGYFQYDDLYIYITNGHTKGKKNDWKTSVSDMKCIEQNRISFEKRINLFTQQHTPPSIEIASDALQKKQQQRLPYQILQTQGKHVIIIENNTLFGLNKTGEWIAIH